MLSRIDMVEVKNKYTEVYNTFGIVTEMAKIMAKNDKLVENHRYQIADLNREINGYTQREKEWKGKEKEWKYLESEFLNRESELMAQNTLLLKQLRRKCINK